MKCVNCENSGPVCNGRTAVLGCITGFARVIIDPDDVKNLTIGEILVTRMTDPESVPYIQKAGGVVTNHGGILCHAAIVCREMNKPCIVGTKTATEVIKTGDKITICEKNSCVYKGEINNV